MARLTSPSGVVVNVGDAKAAQLASIGFVPVKGESKAEAADQDAPTKKAAPRKRATKKNN